MDNSVYARLSIRLKFIKLLIVLTILTFLSATGYYIYGQFRVYFGLKEATIKYCEKRYPNNKELIEKIEKNYWDAFFNNYEETKHGHSFNEKDYLYTILAGGDKVSYEKNKFENNNSEQLKGLKSKNLTLRRYELKKRYLDKRKKAIKIFNRFDYRFPESILYKYYSAPKRLKRYIEKKLR